MRVDASARSRLMPPSVAESVAVFRARAHAPARARALCTSPLLRFVSCPLSLSLSPFPRRTLTTPLSLSLLAIFSSPSLFHSFSPFPCSSFPVFVVRVPFAVRRFARGSRYTHLPPPSRGTFHPPPERGTVARSGRWPRDHVVCISHTLLTYICMRSICSPLQHIGWNTHARTPPPPPPPRPAARTRSFRGK